MALWIQQVGSLLWSPSSKENMKSNLGRREEFRIYDPKEESYKVSSTSATHFYTSATHFYASSTHHPKKILNQPQDEENFFMNTILRKSLIKIWACVPVIFLRVPLIFLRVPLMCMQVPLIFMHSFYLSATKRKSILVGREEFRQYDPKEEYYKVLSTSATNFYASATNFCCSENHFCASGTH